MCLDPDDGKRLAPICLQDKAQVGFAMGLCPQVLPAMQPRTTYILPHIIFGAHQVFHICSELLILPLDFLLGLQGFFKGPRQGEGFSFFLSGLSFSPVPLFCIASRDALLLSQQLRENRQAQ